MIEKKKKTSKLAANRGRTQTRRSPAQEDDEKEQIGRDGDTQDTGRTDHGHGRFQTRGKRIWILTQILFRFSWTWVSVKNLICVKISFFEKDEKHKTKANRH